MHSPSGWQGAEGRRERSRWGLAILLVATAIFTCGEAAAQTAGRVLVTDINGAIGVATTRQITRAIEATQQQNASALIVRLDTPGGLVSATRDIIKEMIASPVPIVIYVAPSGARAASAGTFITYAAHIAAMAPGTNIGAATPVQLGGVPGLPRPNEKEGGKQSGETASERKAINDVVAMLRSLAQLRGRNTEWAEKAVREAATLTAEEARKEGVIDVIAGSLADLLAQIDGRTVKVDGGEKTLATRNATQVAYEPDWRTKLLAAVSDPNIAFILLMIGFYGVILEFWHPGTFAPGVIGGISLILAMIGLSMLPVHYGALALLLLGIALMIGEAFTPGTAILGAGGLVAFVVGAIFLFEGTGWDIEIAISWPVIFGTAATTAALMFGIVGAAVKARNKKATTGAEEMIGMRARVVDWNGTSGTVRAHGEIWAARSGQPLEPEEAVQVTGREGLTLIVNR
jgi:membrane-bound serine protease (ClpP class)